MLLHTTLDTALRCIEKPRQILSDVLIPKACPPVLHSPYRPGYDWLFGYERKIARFLEPWLKKCRYELIGEKGILCEALSNAFYHGHKKEAALPIKVSVYLGIKGLIVRIRDVGSGFDLQGIHENYNSGKPYFHSAGNGLRLMIDSKRFGVFYDHRGCAFHLLYLFNEDIEETLAKTSAGPDERSAGTSFPGNPTPLKNLDSDAVLRRSPWGKQWALAAVLVDTDGRCTVAYGIDEDRLNGFIGAARDLFSIAREMASRLDSGCAQLLSIPSDNGILAIYRPSLKKHTLLAILKKEAKPAMIRIYLSRLFKHLTAV